MSTTRARTRKAPSERSAEIVAAATELARAEGLSALTQRAVATRAGVAVGLVAHYRPMDQLVAEVYLDLVGAELREVEVALAAVADPAARLRLLIDTLVAGDRDDITVVWVEGWAMARRSPALADAVRAEMARWQDMVHDLVADGCRSGAFSTPEPGDVAWQLLGMIDGINAQSLARGADAAAFAERVARAAEALVEAKQGALRGDG
ncbi:TetR family transcriptional regulator C-terminal domain-containing protein [Microbacter sp. GSS18]|nr:TetR family transcriptional regulator C-terminal domain-containing protein [Microbacter sp. GSS18]